MPENKAKPLFRDTIGWLPGVTEAGGLRLRDWSPPVGHLKGNLRPFLWGKLGHSRREKNPETKKGSPELGEHTTCPTHCAGLTPSLTFREPPGRGVKDPSGNDANCV